LCEFGPRTLDLAEAQFVDCQLVSTSFILASLPNARFERSTLRDVRFRNGKLVNALFSQSTLERVCFEGATLTGASFVGCQFVDAGYWGEPPWHDAIVPDEVRFSFGLVREPAATVARLVRSGGFSAEEAAALQPLIPWIQGWAAEVPEAMIRFDEVGDLVSFPMFVKLMRRIKDAL